MGNESSTPFPSQLHPAARHAVLDGNLSLEGIANKIKSGDVKGIVLMTGAGTSVSAGIPDFRTPGTGLYSQLDELGLPCPEAVFHIKYFQHNPRPFYLLSKKLFPGTFAPTDAHFFSVLLNKKGLLLRHYTQNIDNLELLAGVPSDKLVEAHGSFADTHCIKCGRQYPVGWFREQVMSGEVQRCSASIHSFEKDVSSEESISSESTEGIDNKAVALDTPAPHTPAPHTPAPHTPAPDTPASGTSFPDTAAPNTSGLSHLPRKPSVSSPHLIGITGDGIDTEPSAFCLQTAPPIKKVKSIPSPLPAAQSKLNSTDCESDSSETSSWSGSFQRDDSGPEEQIEWKEKPKESIIEVSMDPTSLNKREFDVEDVAMAAKRCCEESPERSSASIDPLAFDAHREEKPQTTDSNENDAESFSQVMADPEPSVKERPKLCRPCDGLIKPDIVFFGEGLPKRFGYLFPVDLPTADLLIVMGTSLQVYPFAGLLSMTNPYCIRLLINRDMVGLSSDGGSDGRFLFCEEENYRDVFYEGECDSGVRKLCGLLGWEEELNELRKEYEEAPKEHWRILEEQQWKDSDEFRVCGA